MSAAGRALSAALDSPLDWEVGEFRIVHRPTGMGFWIANGALFFDGDQIVGTPKCLGLIERFWLYRKAMAIPQGLVTAKFERAARTGGAA